jgi:UDP-glucuronate decarboxylase
MRDFLGDPGNGFRGLPGHTVTLVAGGAGFLGSHLCARLVASGHGVICVDSLITGSLDNIASLRGHSRFRFVHHDIIDPIDVTGPLDEIYNLASPGSPSLKQADPIHTFRSCTEGSLSLLGLAARKSARILLGSGSEIYGDPEISPQDESCRGNVTTVGPRACHAEGKRAAEALFWEYGAHLGVETRIARIFNTYGPHLGPNDVRVMSNFIVQALRGEALAVHGDGSQTRSFCYVDDLIDGLVRLMNSREAMPVNLGNPTEVTILDLANRIQARVGGSSHIVHKPLPQDCQRQRRPDIARAQRILGWTPTVALDRGIDRTIAWFAPKVSKALGRPVPAT